MCVTLIFSPSFKEHFAANVKGTPTFGSFLAFALSVKQGDERYWDALWVPIHRQCRPCCRPYSYILHTEYLEDEIKETLIDVRKLMCKRLFFAKY